MSKLPFKISETGHTKLQQLVNSITEAISAGELKHGDALPSVNNFSKITGFSRDTVFKAYNILKERSVIESAPQKGYFVANESFKVFVLLDDFSAFKEHLYRSFRSNLPDAYSVDLLFHHYNPEVFKQLIESSLGRYSLYIIMNIEHNSLHPILDKIDSKNLLVLDMGKPAENNVNCLLQDFSESVVRCLEEGKDKLLKYEQLNLIYSEENTPHPAETVEAVRSFCKKYKQKFVSVDKVNVDEIQAGQAYLVIRDDNLVEVVKTCRERNLKLGQDVGILSYNDTPMKQIVGGGISVISTNFHEMGFQAAEFVKFKQKISKVLPTSLILRDSL